METKEKATMTAAPTSTAKVQTNPDTTKGFIDILSEVRKVLDQAPPEDVGVFRVRSANAVIKEAAATPDPTPLWPELWYEGEVSCLFADSNAGKSIYAVQIGVDIARRGHKVLYYDFELSPKQFQMRYSDGAVLYDFPPNFFGSSEIWSDGY